MGLGFRGFAVPIFLLLLGEEVCLGTKKPVGFSKLPLSDKVHVVETIGFSGTVAPIPHGKNVLALSFGNNGRGTAI